MFLVYSCSHSYTSLISPDHKLVQLRSSNERNINIQRFMVCCNALATLLVSKIILEFCSMAMYYKFCFENGENSTNFLPPICFSMIFPPPKFPSIRYHPRALAGTGLIKKWNRVNILLCDKFCKFDP